MISNLNIDDFLSVGRALGLGTELVLLRVPTKLCQYNQVPIWRPSQVKAATLSYRVM